MKSNIIFDPDRLSVNLSATKEYQIFIFGYGAVGTHVLDQFIKFGFQNFTIIDFDLFDEYNLAKSSSSVHTDNIGKPKAHIGADFYRNQVESCYNFTGIYADVRYLGPNCFRTGKRSIFLVCVDNDVARLAINQIWKNQKDSILLLCGTSKNIAMTLMIDGKKACLECILDQSSKEVMIQRNSCLPEYYKMIESNHAPTSYLASSDAARMALEITRKWLIDPNYSNIWVTDQDMKYLISEPFIDKGCQTCKIEPINNAVPLIGKMNESNVKDILHQIERYLSHKEFEIELYNSQFILQDHCRKCCAPLRIMKPSIYILEETLICENCRNNSNATVIDEMPMPEKLTTLSLENSAVVFGKTMFEMGFRIGDYIYVRTLKADKHGEYASFTFFCQDDTSYLISNDNKEIRL
jgi:hypothetical protein